MARHERKTSLDPGLKRSAQSARQLRVKKKGLNLRRNTWRCGVAEDACILIDAESYFSNLYDNLMRARHSIYILGWDIDSRQNLLPGQEDQAGLPTRLGALLDRLAQQNPELEIYILAWDFASIYLRSREVFQTIKLGWQTHARLHFRFDNQHPISASHHQKLVVLDDQIAYCGGLDLTGARWDSAAHEPHDQRRQLASGALYAPFHDVQMAVRGQPARWLGELCRERWRLATGTALKPPPPLAVNPFVLPEPRFVSPQLAIARTIPAYKQTRQVREVERLFLDLIANAKSYLYIENQYFTCSSIARAVQKSLRSRHGPEIIVVLPKIQDSWLAQHTMGALSARTIAKIRQSDRHGRFTVLYPEDSRLAPNTYINVHAKVLIADDRYLRVGSANLNKRSMGLDTECDLLIDASQDAEGQRGIATTLATLVGHYMGVKAAEISEARKSAGSLAGAIALVNHRGPKTLEPYRCSHAKGALKNWIADFEAIDLAQPLTLERLVDEFVFRGKAARDLTLTERVPEGFFLTLIACILLATLRFLTPLGAYLDASFLAQGFSHIGLAKLPAVGFFIVFIALGTFAVPLNLLIALAACYFGSFKAAAIVLSASLLLAAIGYGVGRYIKPDWLDRLLPRSLYYLRQAVVRHSTLAMFLVRFFPIAPFQLMNIAAGVARVGRVPYFLGTMAGLLPGTLGIIALLRSLIAAISQPSLGNFLVFLAVAGATLAVYYLLGRRLGRSHQPPRRHKNRRKLAGHDPLSAGLAI